MSKDRIKSIVGFLCAAFGIYNAIASHYGFGLIQFDSAMWTDIFNAVWSFVSICYTTWKNCNLSPIAKDVQGIINAVKAKDLDALKESFDKIKEIKDGIEKELDKAE